LTSYENYNENNNQGSIGNTSEQAGIKLDLGQNKIENLIKLASREKILPLEN